LYNLRNRCYSPTLGRFMQLDPSGLGGKDLNMYRYCANNPVVFEDSLGLQRGLNPGGASPVQGGSGPGIQNPVGGNWGSLVINFYNWTDLIARVLHLAPPLYITKAAIIVKT